MQSCVSPQKDQIEMRQPLTSSPERVGPGGEEVLCARCRDGHVVGGEELQPVRHDVVLQILADRQIRHHRDLRRTCNTAVEL